MPRARVPLLINIQLVITQVLESACENLTTNTIAIGQGDLGVLEGLRDAVDHRIALSRYLLDD